MRKIKQLSTILIIVLGMLFLFQNCQKDLENNYIDNENYVTNVMLIPNKIDYKQLIENKALNKKISSIKNVLDINKDKTLDGLTVLTDNILETYIDSIYSYTFKLASPIDTTSVFDNLVIMGNNNAYDFYLYRYYYDEEADEDDVFPYRYRAFLLTADDINFEDFDGLYDNKWVQIDCVEITNPKFEIEIDCWVSGGGSDDGGSSGSGGSSSGGTSDGGSSGDDSSHHSGGGGNGGSGSNGSNDDGGDDYNTNDPHSPHGIPGVIDGLSDEALDIILQLGLTPNAQIINLFTTANQNSENYTSSDYPGMDDSFPFNWWNDSSFIENSGNFDMPADSPDAPDEKPNELEIALFTLFPSEAILHIENSYTALSMAEEKALAHTFGESDINASLSDGKSDAFRHAFWNALDTAEFGNLITSLFTTAHENGETGLSSEMDLYNNEVGRSIALENEFNFLTNETVISDSIEQAVLNGNLIYIWEANLVFTNF